jgi:TrkA-N domain
MRKFLPQVRLHSPGYQTGTTRMLWISVAFVVGAVAAAALGLGLVSLLSLPAREGDNKNAWDVGHGVIQLFAAQTPTWIEPDAARVPSYDIAKVLAPLTTGYAFATTAIVLLTDRWRRLRARLAHGHTVVCGGGRAGVYLSRLLAQRGTTVLVGNDASSERVSMSLTRHIIPLSGDARDSVVLHRAGVQRAAEVFAIDEDADVNAAVAVTSKRLMAGIDRLINCYAFIDDATLQLALQARLLAGARQSSFQLHLLDRSQFRQRRDSFRASDRRGRQRCMGHRIADASLGR